jgi:hypothetical protein
MMRTVLRGKFAPINAFFEKSETYERNNLMMNFRKTKQVNPKTHTKKEIIQGRGEDR